MGQGLSDRIISRRAKGAAEASCDLNTRSGRYAGRFVSAPVPLQSLSQAHHSSTGRVTGFASGGRERVSHQPTFVRVPPVRQVLGTLF